MVVNAQPAGAPRGADPRGARRGKALILCEKPIGLTHEDVDAVIDECRARGAALVVGTNHVYDPAWTRAKKHLLAHGPRHRLDHREPRAPSQRPIPRGRQRGDSGVVECRTPRLPTGMIPDSPQLWCTVSCSDSRFTTSPSSGTSHRGSSGSYTRGLVPPIGYAIGLIADGIPISLTAVMFPGGADAAWVLRVLTQADEVEVSFPPAFVHAGSAGVEVRALQGGRTEHRREPVDGYVAEWRGLAALLSGKRRSSMTRSGRTRTTRSTSPTRQRHGSVTERHRDRCARVRRRRRVSHRTGRAHRIGGRRLGHPRRGHRDRVSEVGERGDQLMLLSAGRGVPIDPPAASVVIDRAWFRTDVAQDLVAERGWFPAHRGRGDGAGPRVAHRADRCGGVGSDTRRCRTATRCRCRDACWGGSRKRARAMRS